MLHYLRCLRCQYVRTITDTEAKTLKLNPRTANCTRCLARDLKIEDYNAVTK